MGKIIVDPSGMKHIEGSGFNSMVTLCGYIDSFHRDSFPQLGEGEVANADVVEGLPDCPGCLDAARIVFESISKSELKKALKKAGM